MMKRGKPQQEIYRPGSGPLRKSGQADEPEAEARAAGQDEPFARRGRRPGGKRFSQQRREWRGAPERGRDTRSVEPQAPPAGRAPDRGTKPPSGRRHSVELDRRPAHKAHNAEMPPRFRKKILEENQNQMHHYEQDGWNGTTLTFQGTNPHQYQYNTLPSNRQRGRGRFIPDYEHSGRSRTPDFGSPCNSRPPTPPPLNHNRSRRCESPFGRTRSTEHIFRPPSPSYNRAYQDQKRRPPKTRNEHYQPPQAPLANETDEIWDCPTPTRSITPPASKSTTPTPLIASEILDWSEEVELSEKIDMESDAMTRSSSISSLIDKIPKASTKRSRQRSSRRRNHSNREASSEKPQFKVPNDKAMHLRSEPLDRGRRNRRNSHNTSRDSSREPENWRDEIRSRQNSERSDDLSKYPQLLKKPGVLVLPQTIDRPKCPEMGRKAAGGQHSRHLFDHNNPHRPIIVKAASSRVSVPGFSCDASEQPPPQLAYTDQFGNVRPNWYDEGSDSFKACHYPQLVSEIKSADLQLELFMNSGSILIDWGTVEGLRKFLKEALQYLLCKDIKFTQTANVEQHLWKVLYHNIIEVTRHSITSDPKNKERYKGFLQFLIDEGTKYFEGLLDSLEDTYKFKVNNFLLSSNQKEAKGRYVSLALNSVQKILLFLGDLGRYKEQVNETSNYGKCRQWYIKAHEINPKNGKPYNQLAVLAVLSRRKLDAVYYYMRSLMSSNPVSLAKESLLSIFEEIRKKYAQGERKRREERIERAKQHMKQKESEKSENSHSYLRHETWIRPDGGRRVHRTTQALKEESDSEEEDLAQLTSVELNKRFVISYLHVHGKLFMRVGMESFQETATQMLKEFRALLQHSPVPLPCNRFLQLLALNMFAIENTHLKDPKLQQQTDYQSEFQERALVISLQMFNLVLERCVKLFEEGSNGTMTTLSPDVHVLLPAVKIWCDWMLCHSTIWNPPPSTIDFRVGHPNDEWNRLADLINHLGKYEDRVCALKEQKRENFEQIRLPEDCVLSGFTPLMVNEPDVVYAANDCDVEFGQFLLRIKKLLFFGTVFLCGLEPPVLKLEIQDDFCEYVSVVCASNSRDSPVDTSPVRCGVLLESFSDDEQQQEEQQQEQKSDLDEDEEDEAFYDSISDEMSATTTKEVRDLLHRKVELERTQRRQEAHRQRVKKILSQNVVSVHIEVRPKYLVPDTNCFIDHLERISGIIQTHVYTLMVPIVVLSELEGLSHGRRTLGPQSGPFDSQHAQKVRSAAKKALAFLRSKPANVKCVTTKGAVLSSTAFTTEDDSNMDSSFKNDDKILATCLVLSKGHNLSDELQQEQEGEIKKLASEVVLLTDDRNLRVKAYTRNVPVRELLDFMQWAGLGG